MFVCLFIFRNFDEKELKLTTNEKRISELQNEIGKSKEETKQEKQLISELKSKKIKHKQLNK